MRLQLLRAEDYLRTPWKNGLGFTDQIAIHPAGADLGRGDFLWRISSARVEADSAFSPFPGHDRVLVVLDGAGLKLSHVREGAASEGARALVVLQPLEPYVFPGDVPTQGELVAGPVKDLNVFLAKGRISGRADRLRIPETRDWLPEGRTNFAFIARGSCECQGQRATAGDCFRLDLQDGDAQPSLELRNCGGEETQVILISISSPC